MVATLFQHCNAVLRRKLSLQIVSCNITSPWLHNLVVYKSHSIKQNSSLPLVAIGPVKIAPKDKNVICLRVNWTSFVQYWVRANNLSTPTPSSPPPPPFPPPPPKKKGKRVLINFVRRANFDYHIRLQVNTHRDIHTSEPNRYCR